ncbi:hypothetical protein HNQ80_001195 [Anaerosolibacter carboniphilus]|uniref:Uncharacterized protein n=1 Tax=Anaerosolibacter carboniphilus TaxID=1417629 RepID=A0A841KNU0_9FIRM|nr:hypothetical protein [Anaerosolibacter carboniphilus]MBB6215106.1 hypothetical protein [Anaerosolibacter carboniphilus]
MFCRLMLLNIHGFFMQTLHPKRVGEAYGMLMAEGGEKK